jgi:hypothetical protein
MPILRYDQGPKLKGTEALSVANCYYIGFIPRRIRYYLDLPFSLSIWRICTQTIHIEIHRCKIGVNITEAARLRSAASYRMSISESVRQPCF